MPVAYVTLTSPGAVSEAELMSFASRNIPERAAIPRAVNIIEEMPLTAVGKIFKPALVNRESELFTGLQQAVQSSSE